MASVSFTDADSTDVDTATPSFTSTIGAGDGTRKIFILLTARRNDTSNRTITSVLVNTVAATAVLTHFINPNNFSRVALYVIQASALADPTVTSITVAPTFSGSVNRGIACMVAVTTDDINLTPFDTAVGDDPSNATEANVDVTLSLDVPENGFILAGFGLFGENIGLTTWTGVTEAYDGKSQTFSAYSGAAASSLSAETGRTVSAVHTDTATSHGTGVCIAASFAPNAAGATIAPKVHSYRQRRAA